MHDGFLANGSIDHVAPFKVVYLIAVVEVEDVAIKIQEQRRKRFFKRVHVDISLGLCVFLTGHIPQKLSLHVHVDQNVANRLQIVLDIRLYIIYNLLSPRCAPLEQNLVFITWLSSPFFFNENTFSR